VRDGEPPQDGAAEVANLDGQPDDVVVVEVEEGEGGHPPDRRGERAQLVVAEVNVRQRGQMRDLGGDLLEKVVVQHQVDQRHVGEVQHFLGHHREPEL